MPPPDVTVTSTEPACTGGEVAVISVRLITVTEVATVEPNEECDVAVKPVPVTVTTVPPINGLVSGLMKLTTGVGSNVKRSDGAVFETPPAVVTMTSTEPRPRPAKWP